MRFANPYRRLEAAEDVSATLHQISDEEVVAALAHAADAQDPYLANVLATEAQNRISRNAAILRNLGEGVVTIDAQGRVTSTNPTAERMLQWSGEELRGRDLHDTFHWGIRDRPVSRDECPLLAVLREETAVRRDNHDIFQRRGGDRFTAGYTAAPLVRDDDVQGAVVVLRDITEQKAREDQLKLTQFTMDTAAVGIYWVRRDASFRYANLHAAEMLGYERRALLGMTVHDIDPNYPPERWEPHWEEVEAAGEKTFATVHRTAGGRYIPVEVAAHHVEVGREEYHASFVHRLGPPE